MRHMRITRHATNHVYNRHRRSNRDSETIPNPWEATSQQPVQTEVRSLAALLDCRGVLTARRTTNQVRCAVTKYTLFRLQVGNTYLDSCRSEQVAWTLAKRYCRQLGKTVTIYGLDFSGIGDYVGRVMPE